jgi:hypothetical protein
MNVWKRQPDMSTSVFKGKLLSSYDGVKKKVVKEKTAIKKQDAYKNQYSGSIFDSFGSIDI